ncbi:MAG: SpoVG family protein [Planctomycetaceae bacterium]
MEITEVRIKLMDDPHERLQAFCSVTFDSCFVVRDLKIIQGTKGSFVAMPSRKLTDRCPQCYMKNHLRAMYCNQCGAKLDESRATRDNDGRAKLYADIAHPIKSDCRDLIQNRVLEAYENELIKSREPNYICSYDDYGEDAFAILKDEGNGSSGFPTPQPGNVADQNDVAHRIEPAEAESNGPHTSSPTRVNQSEYHQTANATHDKSAEQDDDGFGAGLV